MMEWGQSKEWEIKMVDANMVRNKVLMRKHFYWPIRKRDKFPSSYKILASIWSKLSKFLKNVYINIYYKYILIIQT